MLKYFLLILILIFAAILRFNHLNYDLPYVFDQDESYLMDKSVSVAAGNLRHGVIIRGSLPYYLNGFIIKTAAVLNPGLFKGKSDLLESFKQNNIPFYILARSVSAFYGILEIIFIYYLAKNINVRVGLLTALFLSINYFSVEYSHHVTPDTALSATVLISVILIIKAVRSGLLKDFLIASFAIGLSAAQKFTGIALILLLPFIVFNSGTLKNLKLLKRIGLLLSFILVAFMAYWLCYPFLFNDLHYAKDQLIWENESFLWWNEITILNISYLGRLLMNFFFFQVSMGYFLFYSALLGIYISLKKSNILFRILILFILVYLFVIIIPVAYYDRWIIPLSPYFEFFASYFVYLFILKENSGIYRFNPRNFCIISVLILAPLLKSISVAAAFAGPDTRLLEAKWLLKNNINEKDIIRDKFTTVEGNKKPVLITNIPDSRIDSYKYFISSSYFITLLINQKLDPAKVNKYKKYFTTRKILHEFRADKIPLLQDDLAYLSGYQLWKFNQIRGPNIYIFDLHSNSLNFE